MKSDELRKWRLYSPGIIAAVCAVPICWHYGWLKSHEKWMLNIVIPLAGVTFPYLYRAINARRPFWREEMARTVGTQIKDELCQLIPIDLQVSPEELAQIRGRFIWGKMYGIFWTIVDSDAQMKERKEHFYENGAFYTTTLDIFIICAFSEALAAVAFMITGSSFYFTLTFAYAFVALIAHFVILPIQRRDHLALSKEQLAEIKMRHREKIADGFREVVNEIRLRAKGGKRVRGL